MTITNKQQGIIYKDDFTSLTGWTNGGNWSILSKPELLSFGPLPLAMLSSHGSGLGSEIAGVREVQIFVEDETWYMLYDSGDNVTGWRQFMARSHDRGLTWGRMGAVPMGLAKVSGGNWAATATGWLEKRDSFYYLHRVVAGAFFPAPNVGLPGAPYSWDIWKATSLEGPWTPVRDIPNEPGTWAANEKIPGCTIKQGATYYHFVQGAGEGYYEVGITAASAPDGNFTVAGASIASIAITQFSNRIPENPKVFFHNGLGRWVMMVNLIHTLNHTDSNAVMLSTSLTDWSSATAAIIQQQNNLDSPNAIGVMTHFTAPDGELVLDEATGFLPVIYDAAPKRFSPGWHLGREARSTVLEPSATALRFSDESGTTDIQVTKNLANTDFIAEFQVRFTGEQSDSYPSVGFWFRLNDAGNCYRLVIRRNNTMLLQKAIAGAPGNLQVAVGGVSEEGFPARVRLSVIGNKIKGWLNGDLQIDVTDSSYSSGTKIAFNGVAVLAEIRGFHMRKSESVTIQGLNPGSQVVLRAAGGLPHTATVAPDSGIVEIASNHFPLSILEIDGEDYTPPSGMIWGGDIFEQTI